MINDIVEIELTDEAIRARLVDYGLAYEVREAEDFGAVADVLRRFMDLSDEDRGVVIKGIGALVCGKCGRPSCLCGYSDE